MANILLLGQRFHTTKLAAKETAEGKELGRLKNEFKEAFTSYLNWGGKYEAIPIAEKTIETKSVRKLNEWALQRQRIEDSLPLIQRLFHSMLAFCVKIFCCFNNPVFPAEQQKAYQEFYAKTHLGGEPGELAVQEARIAKHLFKEAFLPLSSAAKAELRSDIEGVNRKMAYWTWKTAQRSAG